MARIPLGQKTRKIKHLQNIVNSGTNRKTLKLLKKNIRSKSGLYHGIFHITINDLNVKVIIYPETRRKMLYAHKFSLKNINPVGFYTKNKKSTMLILQPL